MIQFRKGGKGFPPFIAAEWGSGGRRFKSSHPDHTNHCWLDYLSRCYRQIGVIDMACEELSLPERRRDISLQENILQNSVRRYSKEGWRLILLLGGKYGNRAG